MRRFFLAAGIWIGMAAGVAGQNREAAFAMNERLGRGINMGNCFEAPSESAWGNPWKPEYFRIMSQLGFRHVRIPIRWEPADRSSTAPPYTISASFLQRIRLVVDTALKYKLHPIINMHHHEALIADPDGQKARFLSMWNQIATYFKSYPDSLLFEVLNEPNGNLTTAKWNILFRDALTEIRKTNPTRTVVMGVSEWGGLSALPNLQFPADENIILTIHYYNPFQFTHQGAEWSEGSDAWLGTKWYDTEPERETVRNEFKTALAISKSQHIPIHIGEFGAYSKADINSRTRWTTFLSRWFEEQGFSWAYWEFSAGFGIYNPTTKVLLTPLTNALLYNPMPLPTPIEATPVYISNFTSGNDGWSLNLQGGAAGSLSRSNGSLIATISGGGTESWHVQLTRYNFPLEKGKSYRVSFRAKSLPARSASVYLGMNASPWSSYSGYPVLSFADTLALHTFTFNMTATSDTKARLVIDLGKSASVLTITDIRVEAITILSSTSLIPPAELRVWPNPARHDLFIDNRHHFDLAALFDLTGKLCREQRLQPGINSLNCTQLPAGTYLLRLSNRSASRTLKISITDD